MLSRELAAEGSKGKRLLKKAVGLKEEKFTKSIGVTPGTHEIVALLEYDDDETQHEKRLIVDVERGQSRKVVLRAGAGYGSPLTLKAD